MKIIRDIKGSHNKWNESPQDFVFPDAIGKTLNENVLFSFPDGIPAFEDAKNFVILLNNNIKPFIYLKCVDIEDLGFVCIDPFLVCPNYSINIPAKDLSILGLQTPGDALVLCLVTVEQNPQNTTTNLLAPIIINIKNSIGRQVILNEQYPVRYKIWEGLERFEQQLENA